MTAVVLQAAAVTLVITRGSVFGWLRARGPAWWRYLWGCPLCAGVWVGAAWRLARSGAFEHVGPGWWVWSARWPASALADALGAGALAGCAALLFARATDALEAFEAAQGSALEPGDAGRRERSETPADRKRTARVDVAALLRDREPPTPRDDRPE